MLEQKEQDKMIRLKAAQEASKKALEASKSGGVSGIAKAQKDYSSATNDLGASVSKEARLADASGAMKTASSLKGLSSAKNLSGTAGAVSAGVGALGDAGIIDTSSEGGGALSGAASGAAAGAAFGPYGAAIGGVIGGVTGAIGAGEARKKKLADIEAKKQQRLGEIAQNKADRLQQGFQSMGSALSGLFTQGR